MAIVRSFEEWCTELESTPHPIQVLSDHKNLEYFMSIKLLNRCQACWSEFLSKFNFKIVYHPGKAGAKPDALTRRSGDLPNEKGDERLKFQQQVVLKPRNLTLNTTQNQQTPTAIGLITTIEELFDQAYKEDPLPRDILQQLQEGRTRSKQLSLAECKEENGYLIYRDRVYVPDYLPLKLQLIKDHHDTPAGVHPGRSKTLELLGRTYYWPQMHKDVGRFICNCHTCQRSHTARHALFGILRPLPIPDAAWRHISMDFITGLPWSNGFNAILVVVCRLTKMHHLIPCRDTCTSE